MDILMQEETTEIVRAPLQPIQLREAQNQYMEFVKAQNSEQMLSIKEFVRATNYNIDPLIIDEQWNMMNVNRADELIALTPQMLERLKFSRTSTLVNKLEQLFPAPRGENNEYWGDGVNVSIVLLLARKKGRGGNHSFKQIKMNKCAYK